MAIAEVLRATVSVTIRVSPGRAFDAWLDPATAARFMAAGTAATATLENEPVEGGAFRLTMQSSDRSFEHEGRYVLIDRPRRLVFTWVSLGTEERLSLVTLTFTPVEGGVRLDLLHEGLPNDVAVREHTTGWGQILTKLQSLMEVRP